ncbi:hypothetical protein LWI29_005908 [Acer saccharum]|uniref:Proteasome alpha-type subunits domain-containing protein n=1 Tax=Acer saccharum TaxID=4024 RepID=A0AA39VWX9_ACESA|nr:hypothetical protein LWI29_005908 [Acer saccharum]
MDLSTPKYFQAPPLFPSTTGEAPLESNTSLYGKSTDNPFVDTFADPLCKLNLKETSEFVKAFPASISAQRRREGVLNSSSVKRTEAPSTPGRPVFSFSVGHFSRKNVPSKWDDAEKWLNTTSCHDSPAHPIKPPPLESSKNHKQCENLKQQQMEVVFSEKSRVTEEKFSTFVSTFQSSMALDHHNSTRAFNGVSAGSSDVFLKDKFTDEVESILPNFRYSEPSKGGFLFNNGNSEIMKDAGTEVVHEVLHRDIGTEMTPLGSSTVSRCHTPFTSSSPARHNTPANRSGPLALGHSDSTSSTIDISQLQECHLAKLQLGTQYDSVTSNWSSREEEEEEISKSLRHFETAGTVSRKSVSDSRAIAWEEEEKTKCCLRYQREEAKIQAWVNLQSAKAEAQSRKLEPSLSTHTPPLYYSLSLKLRFSLRCYVFRSNRQHKNMFLTRTEYDRGVNTFSPEGRLFQVEYAIEAIKLGSTAIGLKTKEGVVLAVEKRITSPLLEPSSVEKIMEIDDHIGCAMSGLIADARTLVEHARVETQNHRFSYGEPMTIESTTQALCDLALRFGEGDEEESMSRPFGVSLLIAGYDENGPSLYYTDPSGTFWQCNAKAIGSGSEGADSSLQEQYNKELTLQEAETIALSILKQVMEEKVTPNNVDIAKVSPSYHLYTPAEVEAVISRL